MCIQQLYHCLFSTPKEDYKTYSKKTDADVDMAEVARKWKQSIAKAGKCEDIALLGGACGVAASVFSESFTGGLILATVLIANSIGVAVLSRHVKNTATQEVRQWEALKFARIEEKKLLAIKEFAEKFNPDGQDIEVCIKEFFEKGTQFFGKSQYRTHFNLLKEAHLAFFKEMKNNIEYVDISRSIFIDQFLEEENKFNEYLHILRDKTEVDNYQEKLFILDTLEKQYFEQIESHLGTFEEKIIRQKNSVLKFAPPYLFYLLEKIKIFVDAVKESKEVESPEIKPFEGPISFEITIDPLQLTFPYNAAELPGITEEFYAAYLHEISILGDNK